MDTDRAFHRAIVGLAENPHVTRWYELANTHIQANRSIHPTGTLRRSVDEHDAILHTARAGDATGVEHAVKAHVTGARQRAAAALAGAERPVLRRIAREKATATTYR